MGRVMKRGSETLGGSAYCFVSRMLVLGVLFLV